MARDDVREGISAWLQTLTDEEMSALIASRRDLLVRPPQHLADLAARLPGTSSVTQAVMDLDRAAVQVAGLLGYLGGRATSAELTKVLGRTGKVPRGHVDGALERLAAVGVSWPVAGTKTWRSASGLTPLVNGLLELGAPAMTLLQTTSVPLSVPQLQTALDLLGLGRSPTGWDAIQRIVEVLDDPGALLEAAPAGVRAVVELLATEQDVVPDDSVSVAWLMDRCLLLDVPAGRLLPAELIAYQRGDRVVGRVFVEPALDVPKGDPHDGQDQVLALVADARALLNAAAARPFKALSDGGVGVQEQRRIAKAIGRDLVRTRWVLRLCGAADLLTRGVAGGTLSTTGFDWLEADEAKAAMVLLGQGLVQRLAVDDQSGPVLDRSWRGQSSGFSLEQIAAQCAVPATDASLAKRVMWERAGVTPEEVREALRLLTELGLRAGGWPSPWFAPLLRRDAAGAIAALRTALPPEQEEVVLQADGTAFVSGRPSPELRAFLDLLGDRESDRTWRLTAAGVRSALDEGRSAESLQEELTRRSTHAVPQVLTVLIDDVAAKHGRIQVHPASTLLAVDDEALVQELLHDASLRALGLSSVRPGVLASTATPEAVMTALRAAGHAPVGPPPERPVLARVTPLRAVQPTTSPDDLVARIRRTPSDSAPTQTVDNVDLAAVRWLLDSAPQLSQGEVIRLARAIALGTRVRIDYLDNGGQRTTRDVQDLTRHNLWLEGWCLLRNDERMFYPDRIQAVYPAV